MNTKKRCIVSRSKSGDYIVYMARYPRLFQNGKHYHIVNRGNDHQAIFLDDSDYLNFLKLISISCSRYCVNIIAICLMPNHFHMLATPCESESLSRCIGYISGVYAQFINRKYDKSGHLWQRRYWSRQVDSGRHLGTVWRYIEQNPVRAMLVAAPDKWRWSSAAFRSFGLRPEYLIEPDWWGSSVMKEWWSTDLLDSKKLAEIRDAYLVPGTGVSLGDTPVPGTLE